MLVTVSWVIRNAVTGHFFRNAGQGVDGIPGSSAPECFPGLAACPQAGFQAQAGQLARVENRDVAPLARASFRVLHSTARLALQGRPAGDVEPFALQLGSREQLADIVMQVAAEA